jgi:F-type H+-transporting ATPase subunit gamma
LSLNLEALQKQISSGDDLSSIVRTMKALAATSVRQYEKAAESLDDYYHTVELGLSVALAKRQEIAVKKDLARESRSLLVVFGSDHGLAGRFNEQIVTYVLEDYWLTEKSGEKKRTIPAKTVFAAVGEQVVTRMKGAQIELIQSLSMPSSIKAITPFIQQLLEYIEQWRNAEGIEKVLLFYNRPVSGGFEPRAENLLPVDLSCLRETRLDWQSRSIPTYTIPFEQLLSALLRQYFFVSLYRACALSLAAENSSRLAAMQAAEKNINERLDQLKTAYQQERQTAITEELLDIISGFRAVRNSLSTS